MAFPRFIVAGALNTGSTYVLYLILLLVLPYGLAYSVTFAAGIALGYLLNARWVFKKSPTRQSVVAYPLAYGLNYLLGLGLLWLLVEKMSVPKQLAPIAVVVITVPVMYLATRTIFQTRHERTPHDN